MRRPDQRQLSRLRQLIELARAKPELAHKLSLTVASIGRDTNGVALFSEAGIPGDRGMFREAVDRVATAVLPRPPDDEDLQRFVSRLFRRSRDCGYR